MNGGTAVRAPPAAAVNAPSCVARFGMAEVAKEEAKESEVVW
jgi:hypothetical protein